MRKYKNIDASFLEYTSGLWLFHGDQNSGTYWNYIYTFGSGHIKMEVHLDIKIVNPQSQVTTIKRLIMVFNARIPKALLIDI